MRIAVVQHRLRPHLRTDLSGLLAATEKAAEAGATTIVYPRLPEVQVDSPIIEAFYRTIQERTPGMSWVRPRIQHRHGEALECRQTPLGRTVLLVDDDCIDPALFPATQVLGCEALVWLIHAEDDLQAEAILELALEASLTLVPLVLVVADTAEVRDLKARGTCAIVHAGEILAEGGAADDLLIADVDVPASWAERSRRLPELTPVLAQRLAAHRGTKVPVDYPADLS